MHLSLDLCLEDFRFQTIDLLQVVRQFVVALVDSLLGLAGRVSEEDWLLEFAIEDALVAAEDLLVVFGCLNSDYVLTEMLGAHLAVVEDQVLAEGYLGRDGSMMVGGFGLAASREV